MTPTDVLARARASFQAQAWRAAYASFRSPAGAVLGPDDLELLARAAYLVGDDQQCVDALERAFHARMDAGEVDRAADDAFWLAFNLLNRGLMAQAGGWLARVAALVESMPADCAVRGLLLVPAALGALMGGSADGAAELFAQARRIGEACGDPELLALSGLGQGQAAIAAGDLVGGLARLDEVMVGVTAGEVSPVVSGIVYCAVIAACQESYDVQRAGEWTRALSRWCEAQPDLVPFRGQCLVHRAQILTLHGQWPAAMEQAEQARRWLSDPPGQPVVGAALYEQAELYRLRGEHDAAEAAFTEAGRCGHETQPGLALLRLAQGRTGAAGAGLRRALDESPSRGDRCRLLSAWVEVALAAGEVGRADAAARELAGIAAEQRLPMLQALSASATGAVRSARGAVDGALPELRRAWRLWNDLDAPHLAARVRVQLGRCCAELGDHDAAEAEYDAAREVFTRLGAASDLRHLERLAPPGTAAASSPLTSRETEVLREVAAGKTNRSIARDLGLSEKTVARHLSNIFTKLDLSSRAAATAYAYQHDLVP